MRFKGTLLKPLADQHDRDLRYIDPAGVKFDPDIDYPVWNNFGYKVPDDLLGEARIMRADDGSLTVEGELREGQHPWALAIGIRTEKMTRHIDGPQTIATSEITAIALTDDHADPTQPNIKVTE